MELKNLVAITLLLTICSLSTQAADVNQELKPNKEIKEEIVEVEDISTDSIIEVAADQTVKKNNSKTNKKLVLTSPDLSANVTAPIEVSNLKPYFNPELNKYLDAALQSPDVLERITNTNESQILVKESVLSILPNVSASASTGTQYKDSPGADSRKFGANDLSLTLHQNIFGEGKITDMHLNKSVLRSKTKELEQIKSLILLSTIEAYLNIVRHQKIVKIQLKSIQSHNEIHAKTKIKLRGGLLRGSDLMLTTSRVASANSAYAGMRAQLKSARNALYRYTKIISQEDLSDLKMPQDLPEDFDLAWESTLQYNPIIKAKFHEIKTSNFSRKKELLSLYPSLSADLGATKTFDVSGSQGVEEELKAMLNLKYDFNFGSKFYKNSAAKSRLQLKKYEYHKTKRDIYQNLSTLFSDFNETATKIKYLKDNRNVLESLVARHKKEFDAGFRSLFEILGTKSEFFNSDIQYINAIYDRKILGYTILANTGRLLTYLDKE